MKYKNYKKLGFLTGDILIIVLVLLIAAVMFISFTVSGGQHKSGKSAFIYIDGEVFKKLPLDKNARTEINQGGVEMTIEISDGSIKVHQSNCKNQNCVKMGNISARNQVIACIPNQVYILIESEADNKENEFDAIIG